MGGGGRRREEGRGGVFIGSLIGMGKVVVVGMVVINRYPSPSSSSSSSSSHL